MLDEEFESPEKLNRALGVDVESSRCEGFVGSSPSPYIAEGSADCCPEWENNAKVTATAVNSDTGQGHYGISYTARPINIDASGEANVQVEGNEKDQVFTEDIDDQTLPDSLERGSAVMTEDHDRVVSVEENCDQDILEEKDLEATSSISEYNSLTGRDSDDDDSSMFGASPSKYFQALSKTNSTCDQFFNSEDELAFGCSDWSEYVHQIGGELGSSFVELQEARKDLHPVLGVGPPLDRFLDDSEDKSIDAGEDGDRSDGDLPPEEVSRVRGAGRLDLDDGDEDVTAADGESSLTGPASFSTTLPAFHSNEGCGIALFGEDENTIDYDDFWDLTSGSHLTSLRDATDDSLGVHGEVEEHIIEELKILPSQEDFSAEAHGLPNNLRESGDFSLLVQESVEPMSEAGNKIDLQVRTLDENSVSGIACHTGLKLKVDVNRTRETPKLQQVSAESHLLEDVAPGISVGDHCKNGSRIVDLGLKAADIIQDQVHCTSLSPGKVVGSAPSTPGKSLEDESKRAGVDWAEEDLGPDELSRYVEALEVKETYIDTVLDMEDVLFDGEGGGGSRTFQVGKVTSPGFVRPVRDGSLSASTSSVLALASRQISHPTRLLSDVDWVEVVGAVQRHGGASLGERVVGVKQHTVYRIKDQSGSTLPLQEFGLDSPKSDISSNAPDLEDDGTQSSVLGKTIRLIVQIHKKKPLRQQLQAQHYTCAGCYKRLELALGIVPELVQNWGWRGPRLCEYTGQLFCSTCHLNETAVLPAWVLQRWDFTPRLVSQLAKAYLDSIYDKPMLCVSAVNPYLYARVPVLAHLTEMRRKINKMLACIRCPARTRIQTMLGSRRYLLENNDFCALRDLADLSKGAFAVLPGYMRAVLLKLSSHITRECFLCRELGEPCGAGELCYDEYDVIYPHQDELIVRCPSCQHPFHKRCYAKCQKCPSCRGQPELKRNDSLLTVQQHGEHAGEFSASKASPEPLKRTESLTSPANPRENKSSTRRSLFANFLGSREARSPEQKKEIINMNPLSSPIEL
ncbi:hypothetical protein MPTK1_2g10570 [Marchantia polymorpha subsp. ruderalis]|uniref:RING-type domain-containing protein n=1 Tax=Marchantia polymorpha TaxID=3197 RepID=A0A2R6XC52_MARPO|nr:hypothetical protein MARPO_0023s0026 [Marchantia polymorpha]BBN01827.1 hypothetical protein Mp_2g10570 [Marchantia polymorpha subsp. ruderalis]|eukprot:PTQ43690.1 hypothetical protein MARPO_0023s0026 [Marchantia polymorpha]